MLAIRARFWHHRVMSTPFAGQVVWITGASSGIGRALALGFAQAGADVAVSARRAERLAAVVEEVERAGRRGLAVPCDVTDDDAVAAAVATVIAEFGGLHVAVANAGMGVGGRFESLSPELWRRQFDVNVHGLVSTARHALPALRECNGRLVLIGSVMAMVCAPENAPYCASKFAVRAIGLSLAQELHGSGVSCTTIHPGFVESEIAQVDNEGVFHSERPDERPKELMWPAARAARVMLRAIHRRRREYVFTGHGKLGAWLGRHMPGLVHFALTRGNR